MSHQSEPEPSNFTILFEDALQKYERHTGISLANHPLAEQLEQAYSLTSVEAVLLGQAQAFNRSRGHSRIAKSLKSVISVLYTLSTKTVLCDAISLPFPPENPIFTAFAVLLGVAKDVSISHDALAELLERIEQLVNRLEIYTKVTLERAMVDLIVYMMVHLLHVLGLVTREIKRGSLFKFVKKLLGGNDIEDALQKMNQLTMPTTTAQILKHTDDDVKDGKAMHEPSQQMASERNNSQRDKLAEDLRSWLSPPDPWENQDEISKLRHPGTAAWFLNGETYSKWKSSEQSSLLWIHGKLGAGKSVLCSAIIQDIDDMRTFWPAIHLFYYYDFKDERTRDLRGLLSSLLVQLCHQSGPYCDLLSEFFKDHKNGSQRASDTALVRCLKNILGHPRQHPVYLIVDALDECPNPPVRLPRRKEVLQFLEELVKSKSIPNLHICVTSRPEVDIEPVLGPLASYVISLHDEMRQIDDINSYIIWFVNNNEGMQGWTTEVKQHVIAVLIRKGGGMFRWVDCQLPYLRDCPPSYIQEVLDDLPETLNGTYERALREIKGTHRQSALRLFQCITVASRPLTVQELAEVLAFDFSTHPVPKFHEDWRQPDPVHAILSACSSLLTIVNVQDTQVVQFSHLSVKEFLTSDHLHNDNDTISYYHISMTLAHTLVARVCLGILLHLPEDVTSDDLEDFPLARYAAEYWVDHTRFEDVSQEVEDGMKELFDPRKSHFSASTRIYDRPMPYWSRTERTKIPSKPSGPALHYAALYGLPKIMRYLITEHSQDVEARGFGDECTALHVASACGHVEAARVLLEHDAVAMAQNENGSTPLHFASDGGHPELARLLIEHGAVATAQDKDGSTPLHQASSWGHLELVRVLLEHGAVATAQDWYGSTPLHQASSRGHLELVRVLLEHGAVATAQDEHGSTPLHQASSRGHLEVVRVLLEHGAVATAQDRYGSTPLHQASPRGYLELVRVLLEHGTVATAQGQYGSTPLHQASSWGHLEVVRVLLEHGAVATAQDRYGSTPLHQASSRGHLDLARVLLEHGAIATAQDGNGQTPMSLASSKGHTTKLAQVLHEITTAQDAD